MYYRAICSSDSQSPRNTIAGIFASTDPHTHSDPALARFIITDHVKLNVQLL